MSLARRSIGCKGKGKTCHVVPLTQDWADAIHTLMSAATVADELGEQDIKTMCLREARRILTRGDPPLK